MDGPAVNFKFHREYSQYRENKYPEAPEILDIGVCGLHVCHNAFKTAINETNWELASLLSASYYLFNETYARRSDYTKITGSGW